MVPAAGAWTAYYTYKAAQKHKKIGRTVATTAGGAVGGIAGSAGGPVGSFIGGAGVSYGTGKLFDAAVGK